MKATQSKQLELQLEVLKGEPSYRLGGLLLVRTTYSGLRRLVSVSLRLPVGHATGSEMKAKPGPTRSPGQRYDWQSTGKALANLTVDSDSECK